MVLKEATRCHIITTTFSQTLINIRLSSGKKGVVDLGGIKIIIISTILVAVII